MSRYYIPLTQAQPRNAMLDFAPVNAGLNAIGEARQNATRNAMMRDQMTMQKEQQDWQRQRGERQDTRADAEFEWRKANLPMEQELARLRLQNTRSDIAMKDLQMQGIRDERTQMAELQNMLYGDQPDAAPPQTQAADVPQQGVGRFAAPAIAASENSAPSVVFGNRTLSLPQAMQVATVLSKKNPAMSKYLMDEIKRAQAESKLQELGIDPASAEGQTYLLTGRLPAKAYEKMANTAKRGELTGKVDAGLRNLMDTATTANDTSFESALGPFQGSTPDSLAGAVPINIARVFGEVSNFMGGGNVSPSEVRSNINGATEALAAAIKPLIRGPGEGPWTDADQARLVSIVGDLSQARNKDEFRRRLNSVRDRVRANFGLDLKFDANGPNDALRKKYGLE